MRKNVVLIKEEKGRENDRINTGDKMDRWTDSGSKKGKTTSQISIIGGSGILI